MTCRRRHPEADNGGWFYFCYHCRQHRPGGSMCPKCPSRNTRTTRAAALKQRNQEAEEDPIEISDSDDDRYSSQLCYCLLAHAVKWVVWCVVARSPTQWERTAPLPMSSPCKLICWVLPFMQAQLLSLAHMQAQLLSLAHMQAHLLSLALYAMMMNTFIERTLNNQLGGCCWLGGVARAHWYHSNSYWGQLTCWVLTVDLCVCPLQFQCAWQTAHTDECTWSGNLHHPYTHHPFYQWSYVRSPLPSEFKIIIQFVQS